MSALSADFQRTENFRIEQDLQLISDLRESFAQRRADILAMADRANTHELRKALRALEGELRDFVHDFVTPELSGVYEKLEEQVREI